MKSLARLLIPLCTALWLSGPSAFATNPLILDQFTADPTARVFEGRLYLYPSHDIPARPGRGRPGWFCMEDYHVFSSTDLAGWKDHGVILRQTEVPWVDPTSYSMWAPDCVYKNGKYYFFFPAQAKEGGFRIGVAVAEHPAGPFKPEPLPIRGVDGIDPCVFIDHDGSAYLFFSKKKIFVAKLKPSLLELDGEPRMVDHLPAEGLMEGPFVFERNGIYYLTYPHVQRRIERLEYATAAGPLGPFKPAGVILNESADHCWTVHQSIVEYRGQWYLFYHDKDLSPDFDKNRSVRADRLFFEADGAIRKVVPTLRGVGPVQATDPIQIDRYSDKSRGGVTLSFVNPSVPGDGWFVSLAHPGSWIRFNGVDFGPGPLSGLTARVKSRSGGTVEIRADSATGPVLARIVIGPAAEWTTVRFPAAAPAPGVHDLVVAQVAGKPVALDWISFSPTPSAP